MSIEQAEEIARLDALRESGAITEAQYIRLAADVVGVPPAPGSARQQLAQAGLEVQSYNAALLIGRIVGVAVGLAIWWFVAGPVFGGTQPFLVIIAFFVLAGLGILGGQWVTLLLLRR